MILTITFCFYLFSYDVIRPARKGSCSVEKLFHIYRVFNLKVDRQLSREYFRSDAIYNGSAGMTLCYYMCKSWQDCCRRGENRSWPSVSVESVDNECWCLNNTIFMLS